MRIAETGGDGEKTMKYGWLAVLGFLLLSVAAVAQGVEGRVKLVRADQTIVVELQGGGQAQTRDVFVISRAGKPLGDCMVVSARKQEIVLMPKASFRGPARKGDVAMFVRHADAPADDTASWVEYAPPDRAYKISLPTVPQDIKTESRTVEGVPATKTSFTVEDRGQGMLYMVATTDYTLNRREGIRYADDDAQLENICTQMARTFQCEIRWKQAFRLNGYSGRDVEAVMREGYVVKWKVLMVESRLYQLMAVAQRRGASSNAFKFLNSFEVARKRS